MIARELRKTYAAAVLAGSLALLSPAAGWGCSCSPKPTVTNAYEAANAVFSGKVVEIEWIPISGRNKTQKVTFEVLTSWKGVESNTISIATTGVSTMCDYAFEEDQTYLVYTHPAAKYRVNTEANYLPQVSTCSRTALLENAGQDLEVLYQTYGEAE